jgi:hypothetical protein
MKEKWLLTLGVSNASRDHDYEGHLYVRYSNRHPGVPSRMADPCERSMPRNEPNPGLWDRQGTTRYFPPIRWASFTPQYHVSRGRLNRVVGRVKLGDGAGCMLSGVLKLAGPLFSR